MNLKETMRRYASLVEAELKTIMDGVSEYPILKDSMCYSLFAGGKRIRPVLCLASAELVREGASMQALPAACAMEMIHTYSLIHDDLPAMDNDDFRRGKPSNHRMFGEANAILAGDGLLSKAFEVLGGAENPGIIQVIAKGTMDMVAGQSIDLNPVSGAEDLERLHRLKTGALLKAAVLSGAVSAGAGEQELKALTSFSESYGLLFQITDDILDVTGDAATLGKSIGKDAEEHKTTFVTCYGLDGAAKRAEAEAEKAVLSLAPFGERASFFRELTEYTLIRRR